MNTKVGCLSSRNRRCQFPVRFLVLPWDVSLTDNCCMVCKHCVFKCFVLALFSGKPCIILITCHGKAVSYLDLTLKKNFGTNSIDIQIQAYRKPSSKTIAIHRTSRHPHQQKLSTFNSLTHRPANLPITTNSNNEENIYERQQKTTVSTTEP